MRIGLMGFGKTGRAVSSVLLGSEKTKLQWVMRKSSALEHRSVSEFLGVATEEPGLIYSTREMSAEALMDAHPVDAIVDFSADDGVRYYGEVAAARGIPIVSAISMYSDDSLRYLRGLSDRTAVLHSPNITLGVNFLIIAAKILKNIKPDVDIEIVEEHFKGKPEVSGTAKVIAGALEVDASSIKTIRAGGIIGTHEILFGFPFQTVRLKHESISREAFGSGIIFALDNLPFGMPGLYTMEDLMLPYFKLNATESEFEQAHKKPWWRLWS